jgi:hypothetical protein
VVTVHPDARMLTIAPENKQFAYDYAYHPHASQQLIYSEVVKPLVVRLLDGTCLCAHTTV